MKLLDNTTWVLPSCAGDVTKSVQRRLENTHAAVFLGFFFLVIKTQMVLNVQYRVTNPNTGSNYG